MRTHQILQITQSLALHQCCPSGQPVPTKLHSVPSFKMLRLAGEEQMNTSPFSEVVIKTL